LLDDNKRLAWQALTVFLTINGHRLEVACDDAVTLMLAQAAGDLTRWRSPIGCASICNE